MILNNEQAKAVYDAMCALNNVSARLDVNLPENNGLVIRVYESISGRIFLNTDRGRAESYADQNGFAQAYNLVPGADGWTKWNADGWIEWNGGDCPVDPNTLVDLRFRGASPFSKFPAGDWEWEHNGVALDIVAYRIYKE